VVADEVHELALQMAAQAGDLLRERFRRVPSGVAAKSSPIDLVSDADRDSERLLRGLITRHRPQDAVLGEEGSQVTGSSGLRWVVDPLDGTTNYLYGFDAWSVSIAVEDVHGTLVAVVRDPVREETFSAIRGRGASRNGMPISVSEVADPAAALVATGFSYSAAARRVQARAIGRVVTSVRDIRRAGSAALDLSWVACGRVDGFYEVPLKLWDRAAGVLLVREAGGTVSPLDPVVAGGDDGVLASGAGLHDPLRRLVAAALAGRAGRGDIEYTAS
jgi:myo-inositol-1(or 4)-monophosphatase